LRRRLATLLALAALPALADNPAEVVEQGRVDVVASSPLPGLGVPLAAIPGNVQVLRAPSDRDRFTTLPALFERLGVGTAAAGGQGNAFQPDFLYRGFVASPLVGQPQGISVFQDGVRLNEAFGDVVNWDLVPAAAVGSAQLVPASTPLFGPNALGGIVSLYTKSGTQWPGGSLEAQGGSFGRRAVVVEHGAARGPWDAYATFDALDESGWAAHNGSRLRRGFAKAGYQTDTADLDISLTLADNSLHGTQALPVSFLGDIRQPYTWPDINDNRLAMVAAKGSTFLAPDVLLGTTAYARRFRNDNFSSNVDGDDETGRQATNDRSRADQRSAGAGLQVTVARPVAGRANTFLAGATVDLGRTRYTREEQDAAFSAAREAVGISPFAPQVQAETTNRRYGFFLSDSYAVDERWTLFASLREDVSIAEIADRSGDAPELEGRHRFSRLNPGLAASWRAAADLTLYGAYSEGMRAPTPMELTCADPGAPCRLPNAFLSDPPLRAVVARTAELGGRGAWRDVIAWSAALWRTTAEDDIQFVSSDAASATAGYFRNVGRTERRGLEASVTARLEALKLAAHYARTDATFRTAFRETSPNNVSADAAGTILISPGDRIPGVARDALRLSALYAPEEAWSIEVGAVASGPQRARGDENNEDAAGRVPGFAVVNLNARWRPARAIEVFALVDNLFDARYARSGVLGRNFFANPAQAFDPATARPEAFRGVGAPRGAWLGLRWHWD
jgi:iron complex outermembrane receptor protein